MNNHNKIALLGGDARMIYACEVLSAAGHEVAAWGFGGQELPSYSVRVRELEDATSHAAAIILPTPASRDSIYLNSPLHTGEHVALSRLVSLIPDDAAVIGGALSPSFKRMLEERELDFSDICKREDFAAKNAIPTAEGAIAIAISELPITIFGSSCAVVGFGNCARATAKVLSALGARVKVAARKKEARAEAESLGYDAIPITELDKVAPCDLIVNTAPARLFDEILLEKIKAGALLLDLASSPFAADDRCAAELGVKYLRAPSLPGKYSPESAGRIIGECVLDELAKRGIEP